MRSSTAARGGLPSKRIFAEQGGDRHLDAALSGDHGDAPAGRHPLGDLGGGPLDRLERLAPADPLAEHPVAAERAVAGRHQIADARQSQERRRQAAHCRAEAGHLGQAPGQQGGLGIIAETQAVANPGRHPHDILQGPGELDADGVGVAVDPEAVGGQAVSDPVVEPLVRPGDDHRGRQPSGDLLGVRGPAEHGDRPRAEHLGDDLRRSGEAPLLDPLDDTQGRHSRRDRPPDAFQDPSKMRRRDRRDQQARPLGDLARVARHSDRPRERDARQIPGVLPIAVEPFGVLRASRPEPDLVPGTSQQDGQGRAHPPRAEDRDRSDRQRSAPPDRDKRAGPRRSGTSGPSL